MMEEFCEEVMKEQNKLIDKCTIKLLNKAEINLKDNYTSFDLLLAKDELREKDYKISFKNLYKNNEFRLGLYKNNSLISAYDFGIRIKNNSIKVIAIPVE